MQIRPQWMSPPVLMIFGSGAVMMSVSMGLRQAQGLLMDPLSTQRGWPLAVFSLAVAVHNLMWGAFQPFAGAAADRWGAAKVATIGAVAFAIGLALCAFGGPWMTILGLGVVAGFGLAATSYAVVLGPVGRAVSPDYRTVAMGTGSAVGSLGMMLLIPVIQYLISTQGAEQALWILACFPLVVLPLVFLLHKGEQAGRQAMALAPALDLRQILGSAMRHPGYVMLTIGFFVCGFQVTFIGVHLPGYLALCGFSQGVGAMALLVIGGCNVIGTLASGYLAQKWPAKYVLSGIYLGRAVFTLAFVLAPKSELSVMMFAAGIGFLWLSTVPPTTGLVVAMFGPRALGMLYGVVFFSHQIGSFLGSWLGGLLYDANASYDVMWMATAGLGLVATLLHLPLQTATRSKSPQPL